MREIIVFENKQALTEDAALRFVALSRLTKGAFRVALAGGSTPKMLYELLAQEPYRSAVQWERVVLYFGDERCVDPADSRSNYGMAKVALFDHISVKPENVFRMKGEEDPAEAAQHYEAQLRSSFELFNAELPKFDLILLGMGSDGHTASLFPGKAVLDEKERWVAASEPGLEPFVPRLTLTFPVLNAAKNVLFLVSGKDKAEILSLVLDSPEGNPRFPSSLVNPAGTHRWAVDIEAFGSKE